MKIATLLTAAPVVTPSGEESYPAGRYFTNGATLYRVVG